MLSCEAVEGTRSVTLVFLPGLFAGRRIWRDQIPFFRSLGYKILVFSDPFCKVKPKLTSLDHLCSLCAEVILSRAEGQLVIIGNSVGGLLSLKLSHVLARRVSGVIVSGAPGLGEEPPITLAGRNTVSRADAQRIAEKVFFDQAQVVDSEVEDVFTAVRQPHCIIQMARIIRFARKVDIDKILSDLVQPALFIWGREDLITPAAPWKKLIEKYGSFRFHAVDRSGHCPMIEAPSQFNAMAAAFVTEIVRSAMAERSELVESKTSML